MATGPKKFGAFSGVFTPSILTILGVIMYLRLGWVAGVAGITGIIAIILLAHIISITTGLSISSIATDKKIKAGGIYYILSRSLGLPMGGSIGITLFVGTALSISLYIIGFTESFLSIPTIQGWVETLGLAPDSLNTTRIIGTLVLIILVVIAFISTEIAIKTQFLILTAIALSLVSIFVGFFIHSDLSSQTAVIDFVPFKDFSFEVVFAVFFPAVTGFTAGVAMSGDLKDPKKDIPKGTMWSIFIGLVVYLVLGVSFVLFVDRNLLLNDYNFLLKLAWIPALVIAGIWGATLSSALGGILGGPRILQAVANDHIVPKLFGKGYGINNEPRNALIFTFILSELGILIGDLNIIAGIVTMFYLTAYGFINLAFALEKWASSDFRPSFRISIWVGIIGFMASFMIMFKLDMVSMFAAFFILGAIYYYINRKHFRRPMTSVWQSVNTSLVRNILNKLDKEQPDERHWRPNILLFSGGTKNRPHLIEFGKSLVANQGMISNFDLILNSSSEHLFPKHKQTLSDADTESNDGIFSRRQECNNIYIAIETIASIYGFSGVEPNTVLLGWGRNSKEPKQFVKMVNRLVSLDLNVVLLDYDKKRGFGNYNLIDVWWRGGSNNGNFILSLIKFIHSTYEWRNARVRIMIVNPVNENKSWIERDARSVLANMRIDAEIRIINNQIDRRPIYEIIKQESINSDLVFLGFANIMDGKEEEFIEATDKLCKDIGTTVLVKASSMFKELHIGMNPGLPKFEKTVDTKQTTLKVPKLAKPVSSAAAAEIEGYYNEIVSLINKIFEEHLNPIYSIQNQSLSATEKLWQYFYNNLHKKLKEQKGDLRIFVTNQNLHLVSKIKKQRKQFLESDVLIINEEVSHLANSLSTVQNKIQTLLPDELNFELTDSEVEELLNSSNLTPGEAVLLRNQKKQFTIPFYKIKESVLIADLAPSWIEMLKEFSYSNYILEIKLSKLTDLIEDYQVGKFSSIVDYDQVIEILLKKEASFIDLMGEIREQLKKNKEVVRNTILAGITRSFNKSIALINTPEGWKRHPRKGVAAKMKKAENQVLQFEEIWIKNQQITTNSRTVSWHLLSFKLRLRSLLIKDINLFNEYFNDFNKSIIISTKQQFTGLLSENNSNEQFVTLPSLPDYKSKFQEILECNKMVILSLSNSFPEKIKLFSEDKFQDFKTHQFNMEEQVVIELSKLILYIINNELLKSLESFYKSISSDVSDEYAQVKKLTETVNHASKKNKTKEIEKAIEMLSEIIEANKLQSESMELRIKERLNATWDKLSLSTLSIQNEIHQSYIKEEASSKRKNLFIKTISKVKKHFASN